MTRGIVFPGQGSQRVGMGRALAAAFGPARAVFDEVDEALGEPLSRLMFEGPEADLTLTRNAQPALMAVSVATARTLEAEGGFALADICIFVAGHSLGEYSALAAAGAIGLAGQRFGDAGINIADMALSSRGNTALMLLKLDQPMPDEMRATLRAASKHILSVHSVTLAPVPKPRIDA